MWINLGLGSLLIAATVLIQTIGLLAISHFMPKIIKRLKLHRHRLGQTLIGWSIAFLVGASTRYGPFPEGKVY